MKTIWHFPLIDPGRSHSIHHYLDHIKEEIEEFKKEKNHEDKMKEAIDILHSAETFIRKLFKEKQFQEYRDKVIKKNRARGYYKRSRR